jgi:8-oxo-dGTP diphosphatase
MTRRFGTPRQPARSYRFRPGVYAVLRRGEAVLLTHQSAPVPEFQLPGGGIDAGETVLQALHREVREETGWRIAPVRRLGAFRRFTYMPEYDLWAEKLCLIFLARPVRPLGVRSEPGHSAVWMPLSAATRCLANDGDRHFLRRSMG